MSKYQRDEEKIKELYRFVKEQVEAGLFKSDILEKIIALGVDPQEASELLDEFETRLAGIRKRKILVVDDSEASRMLLEEILRGFCYEAIPTDDGDTAWEAAQKTLPDLIITDVLMPRMNGSELVKKVRDAYWGRQLPIIVITERGLMKEYFETLRVDVFIDKPFDPDALLKTIKQIL